MQLTSLGSSGPSGEQPTRHGYFRIPVFGVFQTRPCGTGQPRRCGGPGRTVISRPATREALSSRLNLSKEELKNWDDVAAVRELKSQLLQSLEDGPSPLFWPPFLCDDFPPAGGFQSTADTPVTQQRTAPWPQKSNEILPIAGWWDHDQMGSRPYQCLRYVQPGGGVANDLLFQGE